MERIRKPFQGVLNIIRFNWHYFAVSIGLILALLFVANYFETPFSILINILCLLALVIILISLAVSHYVYDLSNLYKLDWLDAEESLGKYKILNISAGFDETSELLIQKFANSELIALDFYDESQHTEISIKRARKAYPPYPNTKQISTAKFDYADNSIDKIFLILSAHEIRDSIERSLFLTELNRVLKQNGQIILTEHLRNTPNFLAYNIGAFHFHSKADWLENIDNAELRVVKEIQITPFVTTFILNSKNEI